MHMVRLSITMLIIAVSLAASGQQNAPNAPTPLSELLTEASQNNSQITAADYAWQAAKQVPRQVRTLPDPTFTYQQFSVGSPKPFAGYTTSNFAYVGIGASQELPWPGKLRLRGKVAERQADVMGVQLDATTASVADAVKVDYIQIAYLQKELGILRENERVLDQLIKDATAHYQVGQGSQADILQAQVERTKIVREITSQNEQVGVAEAHLKGLLHRDQDSRDIVAQSLIENPLRYTSAELLQMVRKSNPQIQVDTSTVQKQNAALASAKREGKPDFGLAYMYQQNDRKYPDYYMFTLNVRLPRRGRVRAEVAEAAEKLAESQATLDAHLQQQLAQVKRGYETTINDEQLLTEYREALVPQSDAAYRSTLNSYASDRDVLTHVLLYFVNVLDMKLDEAQVLADHETALAHLETLTGATLR
ncbi:MAG TPA: TolC family protein [Candidatus Angelobacter sp.]|nr:TolC family protein [Candidatus Angelobacter sp.]